MFGISSYNKNTSSFSHLAYNSSTLNPRISLLPLLEGEVKGVDLEIGRVHRAPILVLLVLRIPQLPGFISLSTNHLEMGSYMKKMEGVVSEKSGLSELVVEAGRAEGMLMERLPDIIEDMPVLHLTGS